ncbi:MAG: transporter [Chloroflexi bacterium]|nr:transporter [Chloroflexota bacterium]
MQFSLGRVTEPFRAMDRPIAILAAISFISQVGVSIMLPLLPLFALQLGATPRDLGLMVSLFAVTNTVGQLGSGVLSRWLSPRRQLPLGQGAYAAAVPLIAYRALAGFGGGLSIIAERLYIARVADQARLAFTNGILSASGSAGSVLGPVIGGLLALSDLRIPFIVVGITSTIAVVAAVLFLPGEPVTPPRTATTDPAPASPSTATAGRLRGGIATWQPLAALALWSFGFNIAFGGWITTFGPYASDRLAMPINQVSLIFAMFGIGSIVMGPWLSHRADRGGRRRMVAIGTLLVLLNLLAMIVRAPTLVIFGSAIIAGGGLAAAQASWFALLSVATDGGRRGRAFGLVAALPNLGIVAGATLASEVWQQLGIDQSLWVPAVALILAAASLVLVKRDRAAASAPAG